MRLLVLCAAVGLSLAALSLPQCCKDMNGNALSPCTCLTEDTVLNNEVVPYQGKMQYHWILSDWSVINVPDSQRPTLTVEAAPCNGSVELYVMGPSIWSPPFPDPNIPDANGRRKWNSTLASAPNSITFTIAAAQYFITVYGTGTTNGVASGGLNTTYSVAVLFNATKAPAPGDNGTVSVLSPTSNNAPLSTSGVDLDVSFTAATTSTGAEASYLYRVYQVPLDTTSSCDSNTTYECILTTACGLDATQGMIPLMPWTAFANWASVGSVSGNELTFTAPNLAPNTPYIFNVAVKNPATGIVRVYTGAKGTPTFTRVSAAASNTTIITIAASAGGGFLVLVVCIVWARTRLTRRMQHYRASKGGVKPDEGGAAAAGGTASSGDALAGRAFGRTVRRIATRLQRTLLRRFLR